MDCATYRRLYSKYSTFPQSREIWDTPEGAEHVEHFHNCQSCCDWELAQRVEARGSKVEDYPCVHIAFHVTEMLDSTFDDPFDDPDVVIWKFESTGEFGIPIRDGGSAIAVIDYCPWCGVRLKIGD